MLRPSSASPTFAPQTTLARTSIPQHRPPTVRQHPDRVVGQCFLYRARLAVAVPLCGSFGSRLRDELLAVEAFNTLLEARVLVEDWHRVQHRPTHSALGYLTPTDYAKSWTANHPAVSWRMDQNRGPVSGADAPIKQPRGAHLAAAAPLPRGRRSAAVLAADRSHEGP